MKYYIYDIVLVESSADVWERGVIKDISDTTFHGRQYYVFFLERDGAIFVGEDSLKPVEHP